MSRLLQMSTVSVKSVKKKAVMEANITYRVPCLRMEATIAYRDGTHLLLQKASDR